MNYLSEVQCAGGTAGASSSPEKFRALEVEAGGKRRRERKERLFKTLIIIMIIIEISAMVPD